jgi:hypothetical protein
VPKRKVETVSFALKLQKGDTEKDHPMAVNLKLNSHSIGEKAKGGEGVVSIFSEFSKLPIPQQCEGK